MAVTQNQYEAFLDWLANTYGNAVLEEYENLVDVSFLDDVLECNLVSSAFLWNEGDSEYTFWREVNRRWRDAHTEVFGSGSYTNTHHTPTPNTHPYKDVIMAWCEGKSIEIWNEEQDEWQDAPSVPLFHPDRHFRVKADSVAEIDAKIRELETKKYLLKHKPPENYEA